MKRRLSSLFLKSALLALALGVAVPYLPADQAEARAGRNRSVGRSSSPPASSPYQSGNSYNKNQQQGSPASSPAAPQQPARRPGLLGSLGMGIAGGLLGGALLSALGFGGHGGGFGLLPLLLLAGLAFLAYRMFKQRREAAAAGAGAGFGRSNDFTVTPSYGGRVDNTAPRGIGYESSATAIATDTAQDIFFRVQAAWSRRNLEPVRALLDDDVYKEFAAAIDEQKRNGQINKLENVAVRSAEVLRSWQEDDGEYSAVQLTANIVDYTIDEKSGAVVAGDAVNPTRFEEVWVFRQSPTLRTWSLAGIEQV